MSAHANDSSEKKELHYVPVETPVVRLICAEAFRGLSEKEKKYALMISRASWQGSLICPFQTSPESPSLVFLFLTAFAYVRGKHSDEEVAECRARLVDALGDEIVSPSLKYVASVLAQMGNYLSFGDTKMIPKCDSENFRKVLLLAAEFSGNKDLVEGNGPRLRQMFSR